jgi:DUF1680 family protein
MSPRVVVANPYVESARNQAAVLRGPLVYALESPDLPAEVRISQISLEPKTLFRAHFERNVLGGVVVLDAEAKVRPEAYWAGLLYQTLRPEPARVETISLIPYYAWSNRGMSSMTVWMPLAD